MADDWIKMRTDLYRHPRVCQMADVLLDPEGELAAYASQFTQRPLAATRNVLRCAVVGALLAVWGTVRRTGKRAGDDLRLADADLAVLDDIADLPGFGEALALVGWVVSDDDGLTFPRFFEDDINVEPGAAVRSANAERQKRFRERRKGNITRNVTGNVTRNALRNVTQTLRGVTGALQSNAIEKRREENNKDHLLPPPPSPPAVAATTPPEEEVAAEAPTPEAALSAPASPRAAARADEVIAAWNDYATRTTWTVCLTLHGGRARALGQRRAEPFWRDNWRAALERAAASSFLRGHNDRGWKANLDWFLRPGTVAAILEGKYDDRPGAPTAEPVETPQQRFDRLAREGQRRVAEMEARRRGEDLPPEVLS